MAKFKPGMEIGIDSKRVILRMKRFSLKLHELPMLVAEDTGKIAKEKVMEYSSLTDHSLAALKKLGHPYAKRAPAPPHPSHMIHIQSGKWRSEFDSSITRSKDGATATVYSNVPHARWLEEGTWKMIPRPLFATIMEELKPMYKQIYMNRYRELQRELKQSKG